MLFVGCTCCVLNKLVLGMLICIYGCRDEAELKGRIMMTVRIALPVWVHFGNQNQVGLQE
jgi:hypothetical protein